MVPPVNARAHLREALGRLLVEEGPGPFRRTVSALMDEAEADRDDEDAGDAPDDTFGDAMARVSRGFPREEKKYGNT